MIRITEGERKKVAAALRENRDPLTPYNLVDYIFDDPWNHNSGEEVAARLAELIGPEERTCRVVTNIRALSQTQEMHTKSCSACGYVFGSEEHRQLLPGLGERVVIDPVVIPNYCPNCGARVVHDA